MTWLARGQGDRLDVRLQDLCSRNEIEPVAVGQAKIAQKNIDRRVGEQLQRVADSLCGNDFMTGAAEELPRNET